MTNVLSTIEVCTETTSSSMKVISYRSRLGGHAKYLVHIPLHPSANSSDDDVDHHLAFSKGLITVPILA